LLLALLAGLVLTGCSKKPDASADTKPEVQTITVAPRDVPVFEEWVGTLDGAVNAQIRAQVSGYLMSQAYSEGGRVKKGDVLFEIDPRPFQATLEQAEAKLAQDGAIRNKTELDVKRYLPLAKEQALSEEELDNAVQANLAADAQVKADQAAVDLARVNLGFTKITSPIDGLAGLATGQIGDLVGPSDSPLTMVSTIDPIRVYFAVNERSYLSYWRQFTESTTNASPGPSPELRLVMADGSVYPLPGKFFFADRQININTGTLQIAGLFPNPDYILRPGQYARIRAQTSFAHGVFLIPQRAVTELQGSYQVAVVDGSRKIHLKPVKTGDRIGSDWLIESGLAPGDEVVVEGLLKVKEGVEVTVVPFASTTQTNHALAEAKTP
jgi:membrane fusion protein, multidrug efflux system